MLRLRTLPLFSLHRMRGIALHLPQVTDAAERQRLEAEVREVVGALRERLTFGKWGVGARAERSLDAQPSIS